MFSLSPIKRQPVSAYTALLSRTPIRPRYIQDTNCNGNVLNMNVDRGFTEVQQQSDTSYMFEI